jgi:FkbM family methyltransferase
MARTPVPTRSDAAPYGAFAPTGLVRWILSRTRGMSGGWASRRLIFALRRLAVRLLDGKPVDVETLGAQMRLFPYNNVCEKRVLFTPQFFDAEERAILAARVTDDFRFVDIGANVGAYALFVAALAGPRACILAVEPQPDIFDRLTFNISQNPFGTVKAVDCAVADKTGELTLFLDPRNSGESSVRVIGSSQSRSIRVPATTLVDLLRSEGFERLDAVKLDVEGAEDIILGPFFASAPESLFPKLMIVENGSGQWQLDLPALLEANGYRQIAKTRLNFVYERG